jgi:hypothetical protein
MAFISQTWLWVMANPAYALGSLVGLSIGGFYGFDGWLGTTKELDFKESPRVQNLVWAATGALVLVIGDVKSLDPDVKRPLLLVFYFVPFLTMSILVIGFWGVVVGTERIVAVRRGADYGYGVSDALGDYFYYGYRYYRKQRADAAQNLQARFFTDYCTQVANAVTASGSATGARRRETVEVILRIISTVVRSYHNDDEDRLSIRSNVMIACDCDESQRAQLRFFDAAAASPRRCLMTMAFDRNEGRALIALPLPENKKQRLPGAPTAFAVEDGYDVLDDTSKLDFQSGVSPAIRAEISQYFKDQRFKSFGSVRIIGRGDVIGVVNVEGRLNNLFGRSEDEKQRMVGYLLPLCSTLGILYGDVKGGPDKEL